MKKYDIFISYRREGGFDTAKHLYDLLTRDGYSVSFDIDTLRNGDFDIQLYERIDLCRDFILIVDQHAFDRTIINKIPREKDWLRCELAYALQKNKNIIPIFLSGVNRFPENLPDDIIDVVKKNGPEYNRYYFDEFYRTLRKRFLHDGRSFIKKLAISILIGCMTCFGGVTIIKFLSHDSGEIYLESTKHLSELTPEYKKNNSQHGISKSFGSDSLKVAMKNKTFEESKPSNGSDVKENNIKSNHVPEKIVTGDNRQNINTNTKSQSQTHGDLAGHNWVDLGLSVKWATYNIGASSISDYGEYFAWGEVKSKTSYSSNNYTFPHKNEISGSQFDAARVLWGSPWRMPTENEVEELRRCKHEWTSVNGVKGCLITGKNGNTIFLPANGSSNYWNKGERGSYWSSTISDSEHSCDIYFSIKNNIFVIAHGSNWGGSGIRPVFK